MEREGVTVILLNGASSAGKTSIAKALQQIVEVPYLHVPDLHVPVDSCALSKGLVKRDAQPHALVALHQRREAEKSSEEKTRLSRTRLLPNESRLATKQ